MCDQLTLDEDLAGVLLVGAEDEPGHLRAAGADEAGDAEDLAAPQLEGDVLDGAARGTGPGPRGPRPRSSASSGTWGASSKMVRPTIIEMMSSMVTASMSTVSTCWPSRMTVTRSAISRSSSRRWEMWTTPLPCSRSERMMRNSSSISVSVSAAVGSSMMSTDASSDSALAISTICCCATLRSMTLAVGSSLRPSRSTSSAVCADLLLVVDGEAEAAARLAAQVDVLGHREMGRQLQLLVDHADAEVAAGARVGHLDLLALDLDGAGVLLVDAGEDLHQRRLAGTVLADQRVDLSGAQLEPGVLQRLHAGEGLVDALHPDE